MQIWSMMLWLLVFAWMFYNDLKIIFSGGNECGSKLLLELNHSAYTQEIPGRHFFGTLEQSNQIQCKVTFKTENNYTAMTRNMVAECTHHGQYFSNQAIASLALKRPERRKENDRHGDVMDRLSASTLGRKKMWWNVATSGGKGCTSTRLR